MLKLSHFDFLTLSENVKSENNCVSVCSRFNQIAVLQPQFFAALHPLFL